MYNVAYKEYIKHVAAGEQDLDSILVLRDFKQCMDYYKAEERIVDDCLAEHWEYIMRGHIFDTLVGNIRPDEDLWDYRGERPNEE